MSDVEPLKLIALDDEDLAILSAHLQDAVVRVADMAYLPREKRFAAVLNRFDWLGAVSRKAGTELVRRRSGLRFERVLRARLQAIDLKQGDTVLSLLAVSARHASPDEPAGSIRLDFAGGAAIELDVECVEAELKDLGAAWRTRARPNHESADPTAGSDEGAGAT